MANDETNGYRFTLNGRQYATRDPIEEGRDLLQKAGFDPASDYVLIELTRPGTRTVGLDEKVDLTQPGREEFRAFLSDRAYNFTLNERGYEWGAALITEAELRDIGNIADSDILVIERVDAPDREIEPGDAVDLADRGTEHLRSRRREYVIIVNAREARVTSNTISYAELVAIAFNPVPTGPDVVFTITYRKGPPQNPKNTLPEGESLFLKNRMIFVVTQTNRS